MADEVHYDIDGRIGVITLNRPAARNAVNPAVTEAMHRIMAEFEANPDVWIAILTGAGDRAFSAGADLKAISAGEAPAIEAPPGGFGGFVRYPRLKPVIAAVNGVALAGGCELVLACDIVVAARNAEFGLPEVSRGIIAAGGGLFRLPQTIPRCRAVELILTGDRISAEEAHQLGLVNHVVDLTELVAAAKEIALRICENAPIAVRESLALARAAGELTEDAAWRATTAANARIFATIDAREGPRAFAEKRRPVWGGR
jgi:enoyl-CoA hydratase/carnithine racemase